MTVSIRDWEKWAEHVKEGDPCRVAGMPATVTATTPDHLWARLDGRPDAEPWDWEEVGPYDDGAR